MNKLPKTRTADIVVQMLGKEVLIYDLKTHKAYNLNETSAIVYQACDGKTPFNDLKTKNNFTDEIIFLALDDLRRENLIEKNETYVSPCGSMSRRDVIRKAGLATMVSLPIISSLVAPTAAMAQSGDTITCSGSGTVENGELVEGNESSCSACEESLASQCCSGEVEGVTCDEIDPESFSCYGTCTGTE